MAFNGMFRHETFLIGYCHHGGQHTSHAYLFTTVVLQIVPIRLHLLFSLPKASNKILGDFMVLAGAILYGCSNVGQEYAVRSFDCIEFLGMLGLFGSVVNGIQL